VPTTEYCNTFHTVARRIEAALSLNKMAYISKEIFTMPEKALHASNGIASLVYLTL
jgi:hypothetical protein